MGISRTLNGQAAYGSVWRTLVAIGILAVGPAVLANDPYAPPIAGSQFDQFVASDETAAVGIPTVGRNASSWEAHAQFTEASPEVSIPASPNRVFDNPDWAVPADREATDAGLSVAVRAEQRLQAWYMRFDHYLWTEHLGDWQVVKETGLLTTLGYQRHVGWSRFRAEMFGGNMDYDGYLQGFVPIPFRQAGMVTYLGCRGEYELLIEPESWARTRLFLGMGARFWFRNFNEGTMGHLHSTSIHEIWGTLYPYLGIETKEAEEPGIHFFYSARIGLTAYTYERCSDNVTLHPELGATVALELGVRGERLSLAAYTETMAWGESAVAHGYLQPTSQFTTIGGRFSFRY